MARPTGGEGIFGVKFGLPYKNVDPFIAGLIHSGRATLNELRTVYDLEDAWIMHEADYVPKFNDYLEAKRRATRAENHRMFARRR